MKKYILIITTVVALFTACSLDEVPLESMPPEIAFRDSVRAEMFVNELYRYINTGQSYNRLGGGGTGGAMFDCITDMAVYTPVGNQPEVNKFIQGTMNAASNGNPDSRWAECYVAIRKSNVFLKNIDYTIVISQARKERLIGEAKLHKALQHFELIKRFGGIPIMDDILDMSGDINIPRGTFDQCVEYVVALCDEAANLLPTKYPDNAFGRFTKGSAYGLKAKILLYAASPLYNENPVPGSNEIHRYPSYDRERWKRAAEAALQVINLRNPDGSPAHMLYPSYQNYFFTRINNSEGLILKQAALSNGVDKANGPSGYQGARGNTNLTLEFINMFETKKGVLPKNDPDYNPQKPYENRDKRFYSTVLYSGSVLWSREVETYVGGADYPAAAGLKGCVTGFTMFKHIDPTVSIVSPEKKTYHDFAILRFAEMLLIYAECMNEYLGIDDSDMVNDDKIYEYINQIRARAELPAVSGLNKGEMRELIHRERTIELSIEEQRYPDLKRWRLAEEVLNKPVHGVRVVKDGSEYIYNYTDSNGDPIVIENRIFPSKFYYYPIPQSELDKNTALVKNPGW